MENALKLTLAAQEYLQANLTNSPAGTLGIRVGLRDAGCSGYAYTIDFTQEQLPDDHVLQFAEVTLLVNAQHLKALLGTEIDYVKNGVNALLQFNNPNVINQCGCGESFQFKEE